MLKYGASDMSEDALSKHRGHLLNIDLVSGHVRLYRDSVNIQNTCMDKHRRFLQFRYFVYSTDQG
jgi:hypothetical protein